MEQNSLRDQLRKKIIDMKPDTAGFYTETYNIVSVLVRLTPNSPQIVSERMMHMYNRPDKTLGFSLAQLEDLYFRYKGDFTLKIKTKPKADLYDMKRILDRTRRDLLFYLALVEEPKSSFSILLEKVKKNNTDAGTAASPTVLEPEQQSQHQGAEAVAP